MQMRVSSTGKSLELLEPLELNGFGPGDVVDVTVRAVRAADTQPAEILRRGRIITDPRTGLPALTLGEGAPKITSEMVAEILADFP
jgi:hypothetical protein